MFFSKSVRVKEESKIRAFLEIVSKIFNDSANQSTLSKQAIY